MRRWRRLVKAKRSGRASARRMRQRNALRWIRKVLAAWAAASASAAGAKRLVAERVAAVHRRRAFTRALRAWRDAKQDAKARKRALGRASQRFRAVWMRTGRDALSRWRENTQTKKIILAATQIVASDAAAAATDGTGGTRDRRGGGTGEDRRPGPATATRGGYISAGGDGGAHQTLVAGVVSALAGWIVAWTSSAGGARKARRELAAARKDVAALGTANSACMELRDMDAEELLRLRANASEAATRGDEDSRETATALADALAAAERCEAARYAAVDAHARSLGQLAAARDDLGERLRAAEVAAHAMEVAAAASAAVTRFRLPRVVLRAADALPSPPRALVPYVAAVREGVTIPVAPAALASASLAALCVVVVVGCVVALQLARRLRERDENEASARRSTELDRDKTLRDLQLSRKTALEELEVWRESAPKWKAQISELKMKLKRTEFDWRAEVATMRWRYGSDDLLTKEEVDAKVAKSAEKVRRQVKEEMAAAAEIIRQLTAAAEKAEADAAAANKRADAERARADAAANEGADAERARADAANVVAENGEADAAAARKEADAERARADAANAAAAKLRMWIAAAPTTADDEDANEVNGENGYAGFNAKSQAPLDHVRSNGRVESIAAGGGPILRVAATNNKPLYSDR